MCEGVGEEAFLEVGGEESREWKPGRSHLMFRASLAPVRECIRSKSTWIGDGGSWGGTKAVCSGARWRTSFLVSLFGE